MRGGVGSRAIRKKLTAGGRLTAVDASAYWTSRAERRLAAFDRVTVLQGDIRELGIPDAAFDVISVIHVIHDIPPEDREAVVRALAMKLKRSGRLCIVEPTKPRHGMPVREIRKLMGKAGLQETRAVSGKNSHRGRYEHQDGNRGG